MFCVHIAKLKSWTLLKILQPSASSQLLAIIITSADTDLGQFEQQHHLSIELTDLIKQIGKSLSVE